MKLFNVLALVSFFFFLISCDDGVTRFIPVDETGDGSEITGDTENPDSGDTTNPDTGDTENPDTTPDPADSDSPDTTPDPADSDSPDTTPDPADSDSPDTTPDPADSDSPDTTPDPADSDSPDTDSPDTDSPDTDSPDTDSPDTDIPDSDNPDTGNPEDTCYAAVFNGTDSKIEVAHNNLLNLKLDAWTIEAWFKQPSAADSDNPLVGKKSNSSYTYSLSPYYTTKTSNWGQQTTTAMKGSASYGWLGTVSVEVTSLSNSGNWTHIALVQTMSGSLLKKPKLTIYIDGKKVKESESNSQSNSVSISTSDDILLIGKSFNGSIDSIRISNTAKYSNTFTPAPLKAENDTVAFWDFTNNANDATANALNGTATNVTYTNDCKK